MNSPSECSPFKVEAWIRQPVVAILLVNWNSITDTLACLGSIQNVSYKNRTVIVVDNGSKDPSEPVMIRSKFPDIEVIETGKNLGFTGGNNLGIQHALSISADYILCLNTDTTVSEDFLTHLVGSMEADSNIGIAGPAVYFMSDRERLATLGCSVNLDVFPCVDHIRDYSVEQLQNGPIDVPFVEGCALLMRREVAQQTSGFDNDFFAYLEDADLCLRARARGWSCMAVPKAKIWHKQVDKPLDTYDKASVHYGLRNCWLLIRRHGNKERRQHLWKALVSDLKSEWWGFLLECTFTRNITFGDGALKKRINYTILLFIMWIGMTGPRSKYFLIERVLSGPITLAAFVTILVGRFLYNVNSIRHRFIRT